MQHRRRRLEWFPLTTQPERSKCSASHRREKMITEMNLKMAERLLARESSLDRKEMRRSM